MPQAYHLFKLKKLPRGSRFGTDSQLYLVIDSESNLEDVHTVVHLAETEFRPGVARYEARHDFLKKLRYPGRARSMQFQEFVSEYRFALFVDNQANGEYPTLLVRTKADVAQDTVKRLSKGVDDFLALDRQVDFARLRPFLRVINGAWFAEMQSANLSSAGMFGHHVDRSAEFHRAERLGTLRSLSLYYPHRGSEYHIMVTAAGAIVVYDSFDTLQAEVDLVLDVKRNLLDQCWMS